MSIDTGLTIAQQLAHCTGSEVYYQHFIHSSFRYTEGMYTLAELAGAHWLIDLAFSHQLKPILRRTPFQLWSLRKLPETAQNAAVAECRSDTHGKVLSRQFIQYTDFPFDQLGETFEFYVVDRVMLLKSEY